MHPGLNVSVCVWVNGYIGGAAVGRPTRSHEFSGSQWRAEAETNFLPRRVTPYPCCCVPRLRLLPPLPPQGGGLGSGLPQ